jgi:hypothetical protein
MKVGWLTTVEKCETRRDVLDEDGRGRGCDPMDRDAQKAVDSNRRSAKTTTVISDMATADTEVIYGMLFTGRQ